MSALLENMLTWYETAKDKTAGFSRRQYQFTTTAAKYE